MFDNASAPVHVAMAIVCVIGEYSCDWPRDLSHIHVMMTQSSGMSMSLLREHLEIHVRAPSYILGFVTGPLTQHDKTFVLFAKTD